ncbi:Trehalose-6-phosphate phosphatase [Gammaproteobacteria bacterium]|nr:Trehalose-6-phosphate phosphatase [Gammaproteobacteria bacterium]
MAGDVEKLQPSLRLGLFMARLGQCRQGMLLLDYDGTLAPFTPDPQAVRPYPGVSEALDSLMAAEGTRVVIVTGRALRGAPPWLGTRRQPEAWGSHGRERLLADGRYFVSGIDEFAARALALADEWAADVEAAGGRCEVKPGCIAFHWRGAGPSQVVRIRGLLAHRFHEEALEDVLEWCNFDGGIELRAPGTSKAAVVEALLAEAPEGLPVAYLGDDITDEDAFIALRRRGLAILVRPHFRPTSADIWLRPPGELLTFLHAWRRASA